MMFGKKHHNRTKTEEYDIAERRAAVERIISRRRVISQDFDEKQALLDYLDERYGI